MLHIQMRSTRNGTPTYCILICKFTVTSLDLEINRHVGDLLLLGCSFLGSGLLWFGGLLGSRLLSCWLFGSFLHRFLCSRLLRSLLWLLHLLGSRFLCFLGCLSLDLLWFLNLDKLVLSSSLSRFLGLSNGSSSNSTFESHTKMYSCLGINLIVGDNVL